MIIDTGASRSSFSSRAAWAVGVPVRMHDPSMRMVVSGISSEQRQDGLLRLEPLVVGSSVGAWSFSMLDVDEHHDDRGLLGWDALQRGQVRLLQGEDAGVEWLPISKVTRAQVDDFRVSWTTPTSDDRFAWQLHDMKAQARGDATTPTRNDVCVRVARDRVWPASWRMVLVSPINGDEANVWDVRGDNEPACIRTPPDVAPHSDVWVTWLGRP
jgi:hypothetical protein